MPGWLKPLFCLLLLSLAGAALANEEERISDYSVNVEVRTDGSLQVTELITVQAAGYRISRGIFRDFPVRMISREQLLRSVGF